MDWLDIVIQMVVFTPSNQDSKNKLDLVSQGACISIEQ